MKLRHLLFGVIDVLIFNVSLLAQENNGWGIPKYDEFTRESVNYAADMVSKNEKIKKMEIAGSMLDGTASTLYIFHTNHDVMIGLQMITARLEGKINQEGKKVNAWNKEMAVELHLRIISNGNEPPRYCRALVKNDTSLALQLARILSVSLEQNVFSVNEAEHVKAIVHVLNYPKVYTAELQQNYGIFGKNTEKKRIGKTE